MKVSNQQKIDKKICTYISRDRWEQGHKDKDTSFSSVSQTRIRMKKKTIPPPLSHALVCNPHNVSSSPLSVWSIDVNPLDEYLIPVFV